MIHQGDDDFQATGLESASVIRLGFLAVLPAHNFLGKIGAISPIRWAQLLTRVRDHLDQIAAAPPDAAV